MYKRQYLVDRYEQTKQKKSGYSKYFPFNCFQHPNSFSTINDLI